MESRSMHLAGAILLGGLAVSGCSEQGLTTAPPAPARAVSAAEVCEVVTFDQFGHGDAINSVSLATLGLNLTVAVNRGVDPGGSFGGAVSARAFETDGLDDNPAGPGSVVVEDDDLQFRGEENPFAGESDGGGECAGCAGLGRLLVIPDERPFVPWGDYVWGGTITFTGNFSGGDYYLSSYVAVDVDTNSPGIRAFVDATQVGTAALLGNGSVQTVATTSQPRIGSSISFALGTAEQDAILGSGAIDGIRICARQQEQTGGEGCTLGYWKQRHHFDSWTGYTQAQQLNTVFDFNGGASAFASLGTSSLLAALDFDGGSGAAAAARLLLKQAVAALLNASSPDVDYAVTTATIVADVNAALDSGNRNTMLALKDRLDRWNNAGCPLN